MMRLHEVIGDIPELVFISDCCTFIRLGAYMVFLIALHGLCFYHLEGNLKSHFKNLGKLWKYSFRPTFLEAMNIYDSIEFEKQIEGLWGMHAGAAKYAEDVGFNYYRLSLKRSKVKHFDH